VLFDEFPSAADRETSVAELRSAAIAIMVIDARLMTRSPDKGLGLSRQSASNLPIAPFSLVLQGRPVHVLRREPTIALELANEGLEYSERNNFPTWTGESTLVCGRSLAQLGREEEGSTVMRGWPRNP
jgi:hypothetical protein